MHNFIIYCLPDSVRFLKRKSEIQSDALSTPRNVNCPLFAALPHADVADTLPCATMKF